MSYEVNILVNGNRCKQYSHNGKRFIQANKGSEYSIEIKNNSWQRILAVCSVDGLDVLNGKKADENGNGYVINGNSSVKIDGFRVSNEKVAKFLFDYKGSSYASSKKDGSEKNVGVIGVRLFNEKIKPLPTPIIVKEEHHHHHHDHYPTTPWTPYFGYPTIWGAGDTRRFGNTMSDNGFTNCSSDLNSTMMDGGNTLGFAESNNNSQQYSCDNIPRGRKISGLMSSPLRSAVKPQGFDMGTKYGDTKESKVIEVEFEKNTLTLTQNIYDASRESLIEMGVPLGSEKQVSFPEPFQGSKYSIPPVDWNG